MKELARRATLSGIEKGRPVVECVEASVEALLDQSAPILRRTLASGRAETNRPN